ncbi:MAG: hypothetical protein JWQ90_1307 [Hydrocarboniphaga sp.]|uniref:hypothetical protein n=1 Tax=Hydrocarboniphaga sp. TaxID=2033016 RepID=UPI00261DCD18|nr:hypothetical protein [Hydrocarboniphaga sp.]MDB5968857.1 hypothetical protein [Hydrocarboniphaga sp.]
MPSAQSEILPALAPITQIARPLSTVEYYHSCVGRHPRTLEVQREIFFVFEGENDLPPERWQQALDLAAAANPGTRLRLQGERRRARWSSDGPPPRLRVVEACHWDARSSQGAEFLRATPLSLEDGPSVELILAPRAGLSTLLVLRTPHAIMDGLGAMHFLQEMFRALRGERLLGSNAGYSDVELMRSTGARESTSKHFRTCWLTGAPQGTEQGDDWRRIALGRPQKSQLGKLAAAFAEFAHRHSDLPALIAVPASLRRHAPGLLSTGNFSNMMLVPLAKGDGADAFRTRLEAMLAQRMDAVYPPILEAVRYLPLSWLDHLVSRTPRNYRKRRPMETVVISNLGRIDSADYSAPGFRAASLCVLPLAGSAFAILTCMDGQTEITLNLPRVLSSGGRFDALEAHLRERFAD